MTVTPELTYEAHRAAMSNTDDADTRTVLLAILSCAQAWEGSVRILGNVRASDAVRALSAALSVPAAAVVGEPVASLETLQYYRDVHSDKFGWVKAPIRVVEDACGTLELLVAENAKFRKALAKIAERADDNLPMYTPGAMVHTAEEALGGASHE